VATARIGDGAGRMSTGLTVAPALAAIRPERLSTMAIERRSVLRVVRLAAALAALMGVVACTGEAPAADQSSSPPTSPSDSSVPSELQVSVVAEDLDVPWSVTFHDGTALVSERETAMILEISPDGSTREVGQVRDVAPRGEGGLLGIAVHEGDLFVYLSASDENRIDRYELTGETGSLGLGASETILGGLPVAQNHNGGRIAFGPDGMLYVTAGDAGDPAGAQDLGTLAGKILRVTPDGDIPADNPFGGSPVYSYGHRNPQGIAWDEDGVLYASEFGQSTWDELNVIEAGGNYGWPDVEGAAGREGFIDPVQQWHPAEASPSGIAVTGGAIYIANLRGERLRVVPLDDLTASTERFVGEYGRLRHVVVAPDGALWLVTNNTAGRGEPRPGDDRIIRLTIG